MIHFTLGDKYKIVKEEMPRTTRTSNYMVLLLLVQFLFSFLGNKFTPIFYFLQLLPIVALFYLFHKKLLQNKIDILIILFIVAFLSIFLNDIFSLI